MKTKDKQEAKTFLSLFNVIVFILLGGFFAGIVVSLGVDQEWRGMLIYYLCLAIIFFSLYAGFPQVWAFITITGNTVYSKAPFLFALKLDCNKTIHYIHFPDQIETKKRVKNYLMLSYDNLQRLPPEKITAWKFDPRRQIVLPYNKKTEPALRQWLNSDHWVNCGGPAPDLDVPPRMPDPPAPPPQPTRPSEEAAKEHNRGISRY